MFFAKEEKINPGLYIRKVLKGIMVVLLAEMLAVFVWFCIPTSVHYHVQETYSFQSKNKDGEVKLAIMIPKSGPYQEVQNVTVFSIGTETRESYPSVDVVKLTGHIKANEKKVATLSYDVILHQGKAQWDAPVESFQLQPQKGIESDHPIIALAASRIAMGQSRDDAYRIYKFTSALLSWGGGSGTDPNLRIQSALQAYQTREGVCGDFANLMTALCRASKIPAQSIDGLSMPSHYPPLWSATYAWGHPGAAHAWVEFHTTAGWEIADPSAAYLMPVKSIWFGKNDGSHLSYGERISQDHIYEEMMAWASAGYPLVGAMSDPLRFAAASNATDVSVLPQGTVKVTWNGKWFNLIVLIVIYVVWRQQRRKRSDG